MKITQDSPAAASSNHVKYESLSDRWIEHRLPRGWRSCQP